ncbi:MAG: hypothetical protein KatS3mg109_0785 [Pirellulaceae bacterium]|nr:MAG: hypothetical protein KatS3mg109_0785 [Pirellulaceae bacterium]
MTTFEELAKKVADTRTYRFDNQSIGQICFATSAATPRLRRAILSRDGWLCSLIFAGLSEIKQN